MPKRGTPTDIQGDQVSGARLSSNGMHHCFKYIHKGVPKTVVRRHVRANHLRCEWRPRSSDGRGSLGACKREALEPQHQRSRALRASLPTLVMKRKFVRSRGKVGRSGAQIGRFPAITRESDSISSSGDKPLVGVIGDLSERDEPAVNGPKPPPQIWPKPG